MKTNCLLLVFLLSVVGAHAGKQGQEMVDSLTAALGKETRDTMRAKCYIRIAAFYSQADVVKANKNIDQAIALSVKANWKKGVLRSYMIKAIIFQMQSAYDSAINYNQKALKVCREINDKSNIAGCLNNIGILYTYKSDYPKALEYLFQAVKVNEEIGDKKPTVENYAAIGSVYISSNNNDKALEYYLKALKLEEQVGDKNRLTVLYGNIGVVYTNQKKYNEALVYQEKALKISGESGNKMHQSMAYSNIGEIYVKKKDFLTALIYINKAIPIGEELGSKDNLSLCYTDLGDIYHDIVVSGFAGNLPDSLKNKAKDLEISATNYNKAIKNVIEIGDLGRLANLYNSLAETQTLQGKFGDATNNYRQAVKLKDSVFALENQKQMQGLEAKRVEELKNKEIEIKEIKLKQASSERIYLIGGILLLSLFGAVLYNRFLIKKRSNAVLEESNNIKNKLFSIISHDLRHPINSLDGALRILEKKGLTSDEINAIADRLKFSVHATSNLLDNLLTWSRSQMLGMNVNPSAVNLHDMAEESVGIYSNALAQKEIKTVLDIKDDINAWADEHVVRMVMRNLLDNAIKFTMPGGTISLWADKTDSGIVFHIKDTGIGMDANQLNGIFNLGSKLNVRTGTALEKGTGLGLSLCYDIIKKSGGEIAVKSEKGVGTTFSVTLPAK